MHVTSRRGFLKIAAAGAAGAALTPALGRAAGKTVTLLHESSFIPPFDEYMKNVLAPAYEKETGVKIVYEIISVGSSPARIASISETGTGADLTMNLTLIPFLYDEKYADVGDIHGWLYPLLWSYGAHEVGEDGKTVTIDSDETARAVDFARKFFRDTMFEDVLGWTDPSNNKAWMAEQISCTNNAESILWFAKENFPEIGEVTQQSLNPAGPKGRFHF